METLTVVLYAAVVFAVSFAVALVPPLLKKQGTHMHMLLALSAGLIMGILFIMILPEAMEEGMEHYNPTLVTACILIGFLAIFIVDFWVNHRNGGGHTHEFTSWAAFGGMLIHAAFDGVALGVAFVEGGVEGAMLLAAICVHKLVEVFSVSATMSMILEQKQTFAAMALFSAVTPIGQIISFMILNSEPQLGGLAMALSAGILLFVVTCDLLPEIFHDCDEDSPSKRFQFFLAGLGCAAAAFVAMYFITGGAGI